MKWWLTVMLYMAGQRGSMMPKCVTEDAKCGIKLGKTKKHFRRAESKGS